MTPTSSLTILGRSLRTLFQRWPVLLTIQGISFLVVLPIVLAFRSTLASAFDASPVVERMLSDFDYTTYSDFMSTQKEAVLFFRRTVGPLILISIIIHGVLGSGLAAAMAGEGRVAEFLKATGRFLGRSFRLLIYTLVAGILVLVAWIFVTGAAWAALTSGDRIESEYVLAAVTVSILFLIPVAIIALATEYARILMVREDRRNVLRTLWEGFVFVFQHPLRMVVQHGSIVVAMLALVGLYWYVEGLVGMTSIGGVLVMLVVQQASIFGRIAVRGWHTASGVALVDVVTPEVSPAAAPAPVIPTPAPQISAFPPPALPAAGPVPVRTRRVPRRGTRKPAPGRRSTARKGPRKR